MTKTCSQTVWLYGKQEKITEVFDHILSSKITKPGGPIDWTTDDRFFSKLFEGSLVELDPSNNKIDILTRYATPLNQLESLSADHEGVGFKSHAFIDGDGEELNYYIINGITIFYQHIDVQGPDLWLQTIGSGMNFLIDVFGKPKDINEHYNLDPNSSYLEFEEK